MKVDAIIPAAGKGLRMGGDMEKQFLPLAGRPVLARALESFQRCRLIRSVILVVSKERLDYCRREIVERCSFDKVRSVVEGGEERQHSVYNGLKRVGADADAVVIHDGVRPLIAPEDIERVIAPLDEVHAAILALPHGETIKDVAPDGLVLRTVDRSNLWRVQTPQAFRYRELLSAFEKAGERDTLATDEAALMEMAGYRVKVLLGSPMNIKITTRADYEMACLLAENIGWERPDR